MTRRFPERGPLDLPGIAQEVMQQWEEGDVFRRSVESRPSDHRFVFFEGPPSANGKPGIHHVMARALKDIFCRYRTLKGERVERKAGWDTHGLACGAWRRKSAGHYQGGHRAQHFGGRVQQCMPRIGHALHRGVERT